jgi:hypothetical protein
LWIYRCDNGWCFVGLPARAITTWRGNIGSNDRLGMYQWSVRHGGFISTRAPGTSDDKTPCRTLHCCINPFSTISNKPYIKEIQERTVRNVSTDIMVIIGGKITVLIQSFYAPL